MKNRTRYLLTVSLLLFWSASFADGVITNQTKVKVEAKTFFINKGNLNIAALGQVNVDGMLTVDGGIFNLNGYEGLNISSEFLNSGSLIYQTGTSKASVQQYLKTGASHYVGIPISGANAELLMLSGDPSSTLYSFNEANFSLSQINDASLALKQGQGYYLRLNASTMESVTIEYQGTLSAEDFLWDQTTNPSLNFTSSGFNLIANPYASAIDWDYTGIDALDLEKSIWVWNSEKRRYLFRNSKGYGSLENGIIPVGQAFIVRARSNNASLLIPKEARTHSSKNTYKSTEEINSEPNYLVLELVNGDLSDEVWVGFQDESTDGFDDGIDVSKLFTFENEPQIYAADQANLYCLDMVSAPDENGKTIPINLRIGTDGTHELSLKSWQGFYGVDAQLEDKLTNEFMDVFSMENYSFQANSTDANERFLLHLSHSGTVSTDDLNVDDQSVAIYAASQSLYIKSYGDFKQESKTVYLYEMSGKLIFQSALMPGEFQKIQIPSDQKMLIVKLVYPTKVFTQKVINL